MNDFLIILGLGWPGVLAGLALAAWGVYRRSCRWVLAGVLLTLPFTWYIAIGSHFYIFLLLPLSLLAICLITQQTQRRMLAAVPLFWAAGMALTVAFSIVAPHAAWGQALCRQYVFWPSTFDFLMMTFFAMTALMMPFFGLVIWRQNKTREQVFWLIAMAGWMARSMIAVSCDCEAGARPSLLAAGFAASLTVLCILAFLAWLGWRWRRDAEELLAHKRSFLVSAFVLIALLFNSIIYVLTAP